MTKEELIQIIDWLDMEFTAVVGKQTQETHVKRLRHWWGEVGAYPYDATFKAVKQVSRKGFYPKTSEVVEVLEEMSKESDRYSGGSPFDRLKILWRTNPADEWLRDALDDCLYAFEFEKGKRDGQKLAERYLIAFNGGSHAVRA